MLIRNKIGPPPPAAAALLITGSSYCVFFPVRNSIKIYIPQFDINHLFWLQQPQTVKTLLGSRNVIYVGFSLSVGIKQNNHGKYIEILYLSR